MNASEPRQYYLSDVPWEARPAPFDGFPYYASRIEPSMHHFILLPEDWDLPTLVDFAVRQTHANRFMSALAVGPTTCFWHDADGRAAWTTLLPRPTLPVFGGLEPIAAIQETEGLLDRYRRLEKYAGAGQRLGGRPRDIRAGCLREATDEELTGLHGRQPCGVPLGLERCEECGGWRGECLDPEYTDVTGRPAVVQIECACANDSLCARCLAPLGPFKLGACIWSEAEDTVLYTPGFVGLDHVCRGVLGNSSPGAIQ